MHRVMVRAATLLRPAQAFSRPLHSCAPLAAQSEATRDDAAVFADDAITFDDMGLCPEVLEALAAAGLRRPTRVQADAIPEIMGGGDVVFLAETGSGKTLSYLLPAVSRIYELGGPGAVTRPRAVVLAPTQELVLQVCHVIRDVFPALLPHTRAAYSNVAPPRGDDFALLVATPRALAESVHPSALLAVEVLVLDEADLLLGGAYAADTTGADGVLTRLRNRADAPEPQAVFCAATLPSGGKRTAGAFLRRVYPGAAVLASELLHRPRAHVRAAWLRGAGGAGRAVTDEEAAEAAAAARGLGPAGRPSPAEVVAARQGLALQRQRRVWSDKLWTALACLIPASGAGAELEAGGSSSSRVGTGLEGDVQVRMEGEEVEVRTEEEEAEVRTEGEEVGREMEGEQGEVDAADDSTAAAAGAAPGAVTVPRHGLSAQAASLIPPTLVFVSSAARADEAAEFFARYAPSLRVASLHSGLRPNTRHRIARDFAAQDPLSPTARRLAADAAAGPAPTTAEEAAVAAVERLGPEPTAHSAKRRWRKRVTAIVEAAAAGDEAGGDGPSAALGVTGRAAELAGAPQVLVCTDIAARGLDTVAVRHVIELDFAGDAVAHLHRAGRTGRLDRPGAVTCILEERDEDLASAIRDMTSSGEGLSAAFSRGRSFRKRLKKQAAAEREGEERA